jgi:hypothetical protein
MVLGAFNEDFQVDPVFPQELWTSHELSRYNAIRGSIKFVPVIRLLLLAAAHAGRHQQRQCALSLFLGASWQRELKNTTKIYLQKPHVENFSQNNRPKFRCQSFLGFCLFYRVFGCFSAMGVEKTLQKTFYKKIVSKRFYKKIGENPKPAPLPPSPHPPTQEKNDIHDRSIPTECAIAGTIDTSRRRHVNPMELAVGSAARNHLGRHDRCVGS